MVAGTIAAGLQSRQMACLLEEHTLQQPEIEIDRGLGAQSDDGRGAQTLLRELRAPGITCLESQLWDVARSRTRMRP